MGIGQLLQLDGQHLSKVQQTNFDQDLSTEMSLQTSKHQNPVLNFRLSALTCPWSISTINLTMAHPVRHATCLFPIHSQSHKPYTQSSVSIQFHPFDDTINQVEIEMNTCESSVPKSARPQIFSCRCVPIYRSPHCYIPPDIQLFNKKLVCIRMIITIPPCNSTSFCLCIGNGQHKNTF
jgi:hypothetical protein